MMGIEYPGEIDFPYGYGIPLMLCPLLVLFLLTFKV
jgi:hypothetical protein